MTIVPIIGIMCKLDLSATHNAQTSTEDNILRKAIVSILEEAIQISYERQGKAAGMQTIWEVLVEIKDTKKNKKENIYNVLETLIIALHDYVERDEGNGALIRGKNFEYFNGVNNLEFESDLFCFEMEELTKKGEDLLEIVSVVILHQMANEAYFRRDKRKIIGLDEAAILLKKPRFVNFLDDVSRRLRKYDGLLLIITQFIVDFFKNNAAETLFEGASFKLFLPQDAESIDEAADTQKLIMNEGQVALMKSIKKKDGYVELLIKYGSSYTVGALKVDTLSYWMYTTDAKDRKKIREIENRFDLLPGEACWIQALVVEGQDLELAYQEVIMKRSMVIS